MKVALLQQATRTTVGTQDWVDASVTNDLVAALFFGSEATANGSNTASAKLFFGCTDLVNNVAFGLGSQDAVAAASHNTGTVASALNCLMRSTTGATQTLTAQFNAALSNGVRINYNAVDGGAYLFNCLLISGTDIEVKTSNVQFASTDTLKTVTHNCTGTPDVILAFASVGQTALDSASFASLQSIIGIYDGNTSVGLGMQDTSTATPTTIAARLTAGDFGHNISGNTDNFSLSISSVGASNFTLTRSATNSIAMSVIFVAFRHLSGTMAAKAFQTTLPTSVGIAPLVSGMSGQPQVLFTFPTRLASNALATDDSAGSIGVGVACNNNGTTQQMASAATIKDTVTTTVARCQTLNNQSIVVLDNTGAVKNSAAVNSWDSGGVTENHTAVNSGVAVELIGLAMGVIQNAVVPSEYMTNMNYM